MQKAHFFHKLSLFIPIKPKKKRKIISVLSHPQQKSCLHKIKAISHKMLLGIDIFIYHHYNEKASMRAYLLKRLLLIPLSLLGVSMLVFSLTRLVPGGPIEQMLQQQAMGALSGDQSSNSPEQGSSISEEERERLEETFKLHIPTWKAYLQWLGALPSESLIVKATLQGTGSAYLSLPQPHGGMARILEVKRSGETPIYQTAAYLEKEGWSLRLESPHERQQRAEQRNLGPVDHPSYDWRVIASQSSYKGLLQGSLGRSYKYNEPVIDMILERLPVSLYFGFLGAIITFLISIPLGVLKAIWHKSAFDYISSLFIFIGYAIPGFALGAVLLVYLAARLEWFPLYGLISADFDSLSLVQQIKDIAMHSILPLTCYVASSFAVTTMMMKNHLMEQLSADYLRSAIAKGMPFHQAVWKHALRNAFIPIASSIGSVIGAIIGGSILIERVFDIQGFGMLSFQALLDKDYTLIMGTLMLSSLMIILGNLISDITVALIDPRIKFN